jgi:hypothetical protein
MNNRQRSTFLAASLIAALLGCVALNFFSAEAQQKPAPAAGEQGKAAKDDEPVAITERSKPANSATSNITKEDQFGNFRYPVINNKGEIAFLALFNAKPTFGQAIFVRAADGTWKVIREGEKAANLPENIHSFGMPAFNDNGDLTFLANYGNNANQNVALDPNDPAAASMAPKNQGLFVRTASGLKNLVKLGDEVPNMPSHFSGMSNTSTNSKGTTAFIGTYSDPDGRALMHIENGKVRIIARSGQKISPTDDATFSEHYYPTPINDRNEVAFLGRVGDKSGIFVSRPSGIEILAFVGRPSPIPGANFLGFGNRTPALNSKGEVAFAGFYDGPDAGRGLFFKGSGPIQVIAKSGDAIPGTTYNFTDFNSPALNARGDIAFLANFGGRNRGVFIKTAKGIEPIALSEQQIPGGGKEDVFNNFTQPSINDRGEVVFYAQWKTPATGVDVGIFMRDEKGVLKTVVKRGDKMPK